MTRAYQLHVDTPMAGAIKQFFSMLDDDLAAQGCTPGSIKAVIFGGAAVHMYTAYRPSSDVDTEFLIEQSNFSAREVMVLAEQLPPIDYLDANNEDRMIEYDTNFRPVFAPLHHGYIDRLRPLWPGDFKVLSVCLPSPLDLAITKLGRFSQVDQEDILALLALPGADIDQFAKYAEEACREYPAGNPQRLLLSLRTVIKKAINQQVI